jgi:hypothetical protein
MYRLPHLPINLRRKRELASALKVYPHAKHSPCQIGTIKLAQKWIFQNHFADGRIITEKF